VFDVPDGISTLATDLSAPSDLLGAAKLTGQNGNLRYGTLVAMEDDMEIRGIDANGESVALQATGRDFLVGRLLYEDASSAGRRSIGWMGTDVSHPDVDASVNGIDVHYFSPNAQWIFDGQVMQSDVNGVTGNGAIADLIYLPQRGRMHRVAAGYHDDKLDLNTLGFLTRNDLMHLDYNYVRDESNVPGLRTRNTSIFWFNQWNSNDDFVRQGVFGTREYTFLNNHTYMASLRYYHRRVDDRLGRGSGDFHVPGRWQFVTEWESNPSQELVYRLKLDADSEVLGEAWTKSLAGVSYRPVDNFSFNADIEYTDREGLMVYRGMAITPNTKLRNGRPS
ncbi:MAG: DUF5916 domain-containing protein, partial [Pseudohongiella nitratireducens]|nr:DUF5916 domain-containing protein [Pseudohongiella nitratireducens]